MQLPVNVTSPAPGHYYISEVQAPGIATEAGFLTTPNRVHLPLVGMAPAAVVAALVHFLNQDSTGNAVALGHLGAAQLALVNGTQVEAKPKRKARSKAPSDAPADLLTPASTGDDDNDDGADDTGDSSDAADTSDGGGSDGGASDGGGSSDGGGGGE